MKVTITDPSFVGQYYGMNPETEDLLPTGNSLEVGMTVLIENSNYRVSLRDINVLLPTGEAQMDQARKFNRWATIEHINRSEFNVHLAVRYSDNTKRVLRVSSAEAWFVKKDSLPKVDEDQDEEPVTGEGEGWHPAVLPENDSLTFTQHGTGHKAQISKKELREHGYIFDGPLAKALAVQDNVSFFKTPSLLNDHDKHVDVPIGDYASAFPHAKVTGRVIDG